MKITTEALSPRLWKDVAALFGSSRAPEWGMHWHVTQGGALDGPEARGLLRRAIATGALEGVLAYADGRPAGWCSYAGVSGEQGPKERAQLIPCFYVKAAHRDSEIRRALLVASLAAVARKSEGGTGACGVRLPSEGAAELSCTGTEPAFRRLPQGVRVASLRLVTG